MTTYRKQRTFKDGIEHVMYFKDDEMVGPESLPQEVLHSDVWGDDIVVDSNTDATADEDEQAVPPVEPEPVIDKTCIFCGNPGKYQKFIHLTTVYLCEDDYKSKTTGTIGAKVRELLEPRKQVV